MRPVATRTAVTLAVLAGLLAFTAAAQAAFPGGNGKIAFQSNRDGNFEIYSMNANGTSQTRLTANAAGDVTPAWSPSGAKIAFTSNRNGNNEIYTMNADGTGLARLTTNTFDDVTPAWSRDGAKIVFSTNRDGNFEIYTMNANGTGPARLTTNAAIDTQPAWSANGTPNSSAANTDKIAFATNRDANFNIYTMSGTGTAQAGYTSNPADDTEPSWSPNGEEIAYQRPVGGDSELLYGAFSNALTDNAAEDREPAYAPANAEVSNADVVFSTNRDGNYEIYTCRSVRVSAPVCNSPGSPLARLTSNTAADQAPDWQPAVRSYPRPKSTNPARISLVPAHAPCDVAAAGNTQHEGSLLATSCNPPVPEAKYLTVGTPDLNGAPANAIGVFKLSAVCNGGAAGEGPPCQTTPGDQLDGRIAVTQTDVRCLGAGPNCAGGALSDYAGPLRMALHFRVTDKNSGGANGAATFASSMLFDVPCAGTADTTIGSRCAVTTSIDALHGGSTAIAESQRAIWEFRGDIELYDPGPDGNIVTPGDNGLFMIGGVFFP